MLFVVLVYGQRLNPQYNAIVKGEPIEGDLVDIWLVVSDDAVVWKRIDTGGGIPIGIAGGVNLDYMPAIYSEDFTPGGTTGAFFGHWPDGLGGQFSVIKVNAGFVGDFVIQSPYFYSLGSGTPTVSPTDGFVLSAVPDQAGLTPSYEQKKFDTADFKNMLFPLASGQNKAGAVSFHTDATIYRSQLEAGRRLEYATTGERKLFIYLTSGRLLVNGEKVLERDQVRLDSVETLVIAADQDSDFILIDAPDR